MWTGRPPVTASVTKIRRKSCGGVAQRLRRRRRVSPVRAIVSLSSSVDGVAVLITSWRQPILRWNRCGSGGPVTRSCGS